jgi:hypothetical protein
LYGGKYIVISFVVLFCFVLFSTLFDEWIHHDKGMWCIAYIGLCLAILIASEVKVGQVHESDVFEMSEGGEKPKIDGMIVHIS